jgi:hypothetical protein
MLIRTLLIVSLALPIGVSATEPDKKDGSDLSAKDREQRPLVREIEVKDLGSDDLARELTRGGFDKPIVIESDQELRKVFTDKTVQRLDRKINVDTQKLLLFAWSGSGGDQLDYRVELNEVMFQFKPGLTKDERRHIELFALNQGTKYHVEKAEAFRSKDQGQEKDKEQKRSDRFRSSDRPSSEREPGSSQQFGAQSHSSLRSARHHHPGVLR